MFLLMMYSMLLLFQLSQWGQQVELMIVDTRENSASARIKLMLARMKLIVR